MVEAVVIRYSKTAVDNPKGLIAKIKYHLTRNSIIKGRVIKKMILNSSNNQETQQITNNNRRALLSNTRRNLSSSLKVQRKLLKDNPWPNKACVSH